MYWGKVWKKTSKSFYRFQQIFEFNHFSFHTPWDGLIGLKWAYFYGGHSFSTFAEFPKNWRFLHPDTHTSVWISECKNVSFSKNFATYYDNDPIRTFCAVLTNGRFSYNHNLHNWVMLDCKQRCYWKIALEKKC